MVYINGKGVPYEGIYIVGEGVIIIPFLYSLDFSEEENSMYVGLI